MINQETLDRFLGTGKPGDDDYSLGVGAYDEFEILPCDAEGEHSECKIVQHVAKGASNKRGITNWAFFNNLNDAEKVIELVDIRQVELREEIASVLDY